MNSSQLYKQTLPRMVDVFSTFLFPIQLFSSSRQWAPVISVRATKFNRRRITPTRNQVFLHPHSSLTSRDPRMQRVLGFPDLLYNSATTIMQLKRNWHICIKISVYHLLIYKYRFGIRFILRTCARFLKKRSFATHVA